MVKLYDSNAGVSELKARAVIMDNILEGWRPALDGNLPMPLPCTPAVHGREGLKIPMTPRVQKPTASAAVPPGGSCSSSLVALSPGTDVKWVGHSRSKKRYIFKNDGTSTMCGIGSCGSVEAPAKYAIFQSIPDAWSMCAACRNSKSGVGSRVTAMGGRDSRG